MPADRIRLASTCRLRPDEIRLNRRSPCRSQLFPQLVPADGKQQLNPEHLPISPEWPIPRFVPRCFGEIKRGVRMLWGVHRNRVRSASASVVPMTASRSHHVVIVGGGFGGLQAALALGRSPVTVTLIDQRNFHVFQPLLYQVATGALSPANIASPLRALVRSHANTRVMLAVAVGLDADRNILRLSDGSVSYDSLIIAAGARHHYFGHPEWEPNAPGLKTIEDATNMRRRIFSAFEAAEREDNPSRRDALLTFVVVGGGPTGVELAGALAEIARHTLRREFRHIDTGTARILLVEAGPRILAGYEEKASANATAALAQLGVTVRTGTSVVELDGKGVLLRHQQGGERVATHTVLWGAGVQGSSLGAEIATATGATLDPAGRVVVAPDCSVPGYGNVFVIGDLARFGGLAQKPLPGTAPVAMQQGAYVAQVICARLRQRGSPPFSYRDKGSMATIGRRLAVAQVGRWQLSGTIAWLAWLFVHLMALVRFENRLLVLTQWAWHYLTRNRNARLITGEGVADGCTGMRRREGTDGGAAG